MTRSVGFPVKVADTLSALGEAHYQRREITEALVCFLKAIELGADPTTNAFERWSSWMLLGNFERAWKESDQTGASFRGTLPVTGGRLLIRCLRGLGDAIQFLRYARELREHCDHLTVYAPSRLLPLCPFISGIDEAISVDSPLNGSDYDYEMECSDLPYVFRTTQSTIPSGRGYLRSPVERVSAGCDRLKIGIAWAAGSWNPGRSIPLDLFEPLTRIPGLALYSLQRGPEAGQLRAFAHREAVLDAESEAGDIVDTMAVVAKLDLVISVDTMVAHLAGALGRPVWTLLPHAADWRWMLDRCDSPWYSSMRLLRQTSPGDWGGVVNRVTKRLLR
ncbi:MAG: glycosyltransferase [Bryobacteraceae bacterium]